MGLYTYFVRSMLAHRGGRFGFLVLMIQWFFAWPLSNWIRSLLKPSRLPRELAWRELRGCFTGLRAYLKARRQAAGIIRSMGSQPALTATPQGVLPPLFNPGESRDEDGAIALRTVELMGPVADIDRVSRYDIVQVLFTRHRISLRHCCIRNIGQPILADRLIDVVVTNLQYRILDPAESMPPKTVWATAMTTLRRYLRRDRPADEPTEAAERLPDTVPVSVVLATFDRPADLERALQSLVNQKTSRKVEIIVVDNHPSSGLTKPVVQKFPGVVLVEEPRAGLAYARNAGFAACKGEIAIATDDDVTMPPYWIEKLVAPFARKDVMVVTGNVLPIELESKSQQIFESYGGLGRGFDTFEVDGDWFDAYQRQAVPTWRLGATANAAFRCSVFDDSRIGLMDEALGPGMPSGVGEDTYLFYKVLKAGYTICYEPAAYVWHTHRRDMPALRRQLWGYGKGGPSYHLTTFARDGDWRGLYRIFIELPKLFWWRLKARLRRWNEYPLSLLWLELRGNLIGPWAWWKSYRRVKREGKSAPYRQVAERSAELFGTGV